jgi:hypothetical protein
MMSPSCWWTARCIALPLTLLAVETSAKIPMPFEYKGFEHFPASFFGADIWGIENDTEMAMVAKHQISGWGWQQGCMQQCCSGACNCESSNPQGCPTKPPEGYTPANGHANEEGALYNQSRAFKHYLDTHPASTTQGIFVYRQLSTPCWWWKKIYEAYTDPSKRGFFFTSKSTGEYCWSSGPIWYARSSNYTCRYAPCASIALAVIWVGLPQGLSQRISSPILSGRDHRGNHR